MEEHIQIVRQFQRAQNALAHHTRQRTVWNETKIKKLTNWITLTALANRIRNHSNNNNHLFFFSSINSAQCRLFPISQNYTKRNWARASSSSRTKKKQIMSVEWPSDRKDLFDRATVLRWYVPVSRTITNRFTLTFSVFALWRFVFFLF